MYTITLFCFMYTNFHEIPVQNGRIATVYTQAFVQKISVIRPLLSYSVTCIMNNTCTLIHVYKQYLYTHINGTYVTMCACTFVTHEILSLTLKSR